MRRNEVATDITARDQTGRAFSSFQGNLEKAERRAAAFGSQFRKVAAAATAFGVAISAAAFKGATEIDRLAKAGRRIDTSVGGMRALELAAGEAGVQVGALTDAVQNIDRDVARGTAGATRALKQLGLEAKDIAGLEADEKLALIADRVKALGLTSGQTSGLLRDLGVRNRDMILLLSQGGDALRSARKDVQDYGLALSAVDAAKIETANDQIARLGLVSQFAGQVLAVEMVPAMGRFAEAMTDSLREGGFLRQMIEGFARNFEALAAAVGATAGVMAGRYVLALGAAKVATFQLTAATMGLRTALLKSGLGAVAVLAGTAAAAYLAMKDKGTDPARASQEALNTALGDFYTTRAPSAGKSAIDLANANYQLAQSAMEAAEAEVAKRRAMLDTAANPRTLRNRNIALDAAQADLKAAEDAVEQARKRMGHAVRTVAGSASEEMSRMQAAAHDVTVTFDGLGESVSNMSVNATGSLMELPDVLDDIETAGVSAFENMGREVSSAFRNVESLSQGFGNLARRLTDMAMDSAINGLFSALGNTQTGQAIGGMFASVFGPPRATGGAVSSNRIHKVGERGVELFKPSSNGTIIPNSALGGAPAQITINNYSGQPVEAQRGPNGRIDVTIGKQMAAALRGDPDVRRAMAQGYGLTGAG